ncbi:MAG TPA: SigE family RNA polymerase sigma factor [Actinocrinis sp.]|nr:SigE family RNA polymerase sigma factor [Actinospica sp.]HEU5427593.1 SigE family RNA polymerase sigma factor [Actinocrinis sp.]
MTRSPRQSSDIDETDRSHRPGEHATTAGLPAAVAEPPDPEPPDFESYAAARQHHLYRTAYLLCGDRDRAQDLVQTTLVALLRSWRKARLAENPDAYAKKALVRAFLTEQRKLRRSVTAHAILRTEPGTTAAAADPAELRLVVLDALRALPAKPRTMVILRYWEDLSVEETAALLGCSAGNVKSQCSRSLAKLRELLGDRFTELSEP